MIPRRNATCRHPSGSLKGHRSNLPSTGTFPVLRPRKTFPFVLAPMLMFGIGVENAQGQQNVAEKEYIALSRPDPSRSKSKGCSLRDEKSSPLSV
jgi:hypothetical protein